MLGGRAPDAAAPQLSPARVGAQRRDCRAPVSAAPSRHRQPPVHCAARRRGENVAGDLYVDERRARVHPWSRARSVFRIRKPRTTRGAAPHARTRAAAPTATFAAGCARLSLRALADRAPWWRSRRTPRRARCAPRRSQPRRWAGHPAHDTRPARAHPPAQSALRALLSCPTQSIRTEAPPADIGAAQLTLPLPVDGAPGVWFLGYASPRSFGAASYLVRLQGGGNAMVDAPRWNAPLRAALERLGGVSVIFLTHADDVGDAAEWAAHFRAPRDMHAADCGRGAATRGLERELRGAGPWPLVEAAGGAEAEIIATPGHTAGSCSLLHRPSGVLFTGDHLAWDAGRGRLEAHRDYCWHDWALQLRSVRALLGLPFTHVLPGHGRPIRRARTRVCCPRSSRDHASTAAARSLALRPSCCRRRAAAQLRVGAAEGRGAATAAAGGGRARAGGGARGCRAGRGDGRALRHRGGGQPGPTGLRRVPA